MTRFCSVGKEYWALQCTKVFDFLRNDLNYKDWYPDYKSFSNEAASTKCALTDIMFLDGSETLFEGQQILAGCYGRRAVVPYNIAVEDDRLYNSIKIHYSKVGLMIFEYNETVRKYVALHWFPCSSYNKNIPDELYAQEPPRGIFDVQEVHQILLGYYITNKLQVQYVFLLLFSFLIELYILALSLQVNIRKELKILKKIVKGSELRSLNIISIDKLLNCFGKTKKKN